jgi:hypothetical protein
MYRLIELLLDGSSRVPRLRELAHQFRREAGPVPTQPFVDWQDGSRAAECELLARLGLLADAKVDQDA